MWENFKNEEVRLSDLKTYLFQWKVPRPIRTLVIREMEILGLLEKTNKFFITIKRPSFNIEETNKYFMELRIFDYGENTNI